MNKMQLFFGIVFVAILLVGVPLFLQLFKQQGAIQQVPQIPTPIPEIIQSNKQLASFSISAGAIVVSFSSSISAAMQSNISAITIPELSLKSSWVDESTFVLESTSPIDAKQTYSLRVSSPLGIVSGSIPGSQLLNFAELNKQQSQADKSFGQAKQQIIDQYPWINDLPLMTNDYFVYFDTQQKQFVAKLYPSSSSSTPTDTQIANFKQEVLSQLAGFGINTTQYPISWVVVPNGGQ